MVSENVKCGINKKKDQQKFINSFGELSSDGITLFIFEKKQEIKFQDIIKIRFVKTQVLHLNYLAFLISMLLLFLVKNNVLSNVQYTVVVLASMALLLLSFYFKSFNYKFMLIKKNDFIMIDVPTNLSVEAKNLVNQYQLLVRLKSSYTSPLAPA